MNINGRVYLFLSSDRQAHIPRCLATLTPQLLREPLAAGLQGSERLLVVVEELLGEPGVVAALGQAVDGAPLELEAAQRLHDRRFRAREALGEVEAEELLHRDLELGQAV